MAFDAVVQTLGPRGERALPIDDFFLLPGDTPEVEHPIGPGELILGIDVPGAPIARRSTYLKFRDRQSYEFALVSVAAALAVEDGVVADVRLALGGVGTKPWRARRAEAELVGGPASEAAFRRAAAAELEAAVVREHNAFKVELAQRAIVRGLSHSTEREVVMTAVGTPVTRVDGPAKVTGAARYSAEMSLPGMTYLAIVGATIAERPGERDRRRGGASR